jgi:hypothetical protein
MKLLRHVTHIGTGTFERKKHSEDLGVDGTLGRQSGKV